MKRRHHNTKGLQQIKLGKTRDQVDRMAKTILKKDSMTPELKIRARDAEIVRLKTELEEWQDSVQNFREKLRIAQNDLAELKQGLAELREAVAGYFKCLDWRDNCTLSTSNSHKQKLIREAKHAEQQLREIGGEDGN